MDDSHSPISTQTLPSAISLIRAIKRIEKLEHIGYSPTARDKLRMSERIDKSDKIKLTEEEIEKEQDNTEIVSELSVLSTKHAQNSASGYIGNPFTLRITRAGCEFDGIINPLDKLHPDSDAPKLELTEAEEDALEERLECWFDHADVSGYGDMREQVTRVDAAVRAAREIPASEFSVEPELLERIADLWDQHFFPNTGTRVEAYKIHLYGPGGHFKLHRDTPEMHLVGTFLLGLGDTTHGGCGLYVDGEEMPAHQGRWCAFYPDLPHQVWKLPFGYRAVIAFKLFRTLAADAQETATSLAVRQQVSELIGKMKPPFGIMLEGKYCQGTTKFTGFDAHLLASARAQLGAAVRHLPVVVKAHMQWGEECDNCGEACVYPLTPGHVDALAVEDEIADEYEQALEEGLLDEDELIDGSRFDHITCGTPWLNGVKNVPFFSLNTKRSLYLFDSREVDEVDYTGNEYRPGEEDCVYLSLVEQNALDNALRQRLLSDTPTPGPVTVLRTPYV